MGFTFTELVAALLGANLITVAFVGAVIHANKNPGYSYPFVIWVGLLGPLLFVASAVVTAAQ